MGESGSGVEGGDGEDATEGDQEGGDGDQGVCIDGRKEVGPEKYSCSQEEESVGGDR